eukprot:gene11621-34329_t
MNPGFALSPSCSYSQYVNRQRSLNTFRRASYPMGYIYAQFLSLVGTQLARDLELGPDETTARFDHESACSSDLAEYQHEWHVDVVLPSDSVPCCANVMFVFKAFWAVALLLIAVNAVSVATAQAGGSKRELIGDEYKGLLQAMDHKVSTARRLLKDVGATQGERTSQILDSIEDGMGGAVLTKHNGAHDIQIDGIVMFVYKAFWAVALLLIAANAVSVAAAQAGGSKREVIGDEYKGLLQSMDHKDSTARRLLKDFGATEGERTKRILDSIEEATGPAGLLMDFSAHDSQIDSIIRVLMEAEHMDIPPSPPPSAPPMPPTPPSPPPMPPSPPNPPPLYRHRPPPYGAVESLSRKLIALVLSLEDDKVALKSDTIEENV